jgi:hypothetical protein
MKSAKSLFISVCFLIGTFGAVVGFIVNVQPKVTEAQTPDVGKFCLHKNGENLYLDWNCRMILSFMADDSEKDIYNFPNLWDKNGPNMEKLKAVFEVNPTPENKKVLNELVKFYQP